VGEERKAQGFGGKVRRKETTRKTEAIGGRMGSEWILGRLAKGWIKVAHDRGFGGLL
jgi:hypothetical protein